jgi:hypothetical protein
MWPFCSQTPALFDDDMRNSDLDGAIHDDVTSCQSCPAGTYR